MNQRTIKSGFTLIEILVVLGILVIILGIILGVFPLFNKTEALNKDTDLVVESLAEARSQTLSSQNASQYGVHFASTTITIFTGSTYSSTNSSNRNLSLFSTDTVLSLSLTGGGNDVVFNRLTGETSQNGTIIISSPTSSKTKTVTIYKTGVIESN